MKNKKKIWTVSFICVGVGILLMIFGFALGGRAGFYIDKTGFHSVREESRNSEGTDKVQAKKSLPGFTQIEMDLEYADLEIIPSDDYAIEYCIEDGGEGPVCTVAEGKLTFRERKPFSGIQFFSLGGFSFGSIGEVKESSHYVRLYVPAEEDYGEIKIHQEDGHVVISGLKADSLTIKDDYGNMDLKQMELGKMKLKAGGGKIEIKETTAEESEIKNDYGDVTLTGYQGDSLTTELGDGNFKAEDMDISDLNVENEYGNVELAMLRAPGEYNLDFVTEYGIIRVEEETMADEDGAEYRVNNKADRDLKVVCEDGNITFTGK